MRVLIIGGTGTLSRDCVKELIAKGYNTVVLNRGSKELPKGASSLVFDYRGAEQEKLEAVMRDEKFDVVVDFLTYNAQDMRRNINVFRGKIKQYIFISTMSMCSKPIDNYLMDEMTSVGENTSEYAYNKFEAERVLDNCADFEYTIVRPSYTYDIYNVPVAYGNAKNSWSVVSRMQKGKKVILHGDGTGLWCFTNSRDFARGVLGLIMNKAAFAQTVNVTSDEIITWNHLYKTIAKALGVELHVEYVPSSLLQKIDPAGGGGLVADKMYSFVPVIDKLKSIVPEYKAQIDIESGVRDALEFMMDNKECQVEEPEYDALCDKIVTTMEKFSDEVNNI